MGWNDHMEDFEPELPNQATLHEHPFEPDDHWLKNAPAELQAVAMRRWFLARFCDPVHDLPYNGREGGYVFVNGGPYDPDEELQERFHDVVDLDVIQELVHELYQEVGDEWTPIDRDEPDWDDQLFLTVSSRSDPYEMLETRLGEIVQTINGVEQLPTFQLITNLAHGATITALETYLWDVVTFWTCNDHEIFKRFVSTSKGDFGDKKLKVSEIFATVDSLQDSFKKHLQELVWHRLHVVKPMIEEGFEIKIPEIKDLMRHVLVRNHIVHRGGKTFEGEEIVLKPADVRDVVISVRFFASSIENELKKKYPPPADDAVEF